MLCACSGEQFKAEEPPQSPESLATRDFSASGLSSRTGGERDTKFEDSQVDDVESTLKEALSLNYEEARALLGRLEYQRGNYGAALQVFQGIDIRTLTPRMTKAITYRIYPRKPRSKPDGNVFPNAMSIHSVSLLLEAILLKARSLEGLDRNSEAAKECKIILDIVESALPNGLPEFIPEDCKLLEMFHKALELLPKLWMNSGLVEEAIIAYRRALSKPWSLDPQRLAIVQKNLASILLYSGVEPNTTKNGTEEAIVLLLTLMRKIGLGEIIWDQEIMDHLTYALSVTGHWELLAQHYEQVLPGIYSRTDRWYYLALCYAAAGERDTALNLLTKISGFSEAKHKPHVPSLLLAAKLCSEDVKHSRDGINFARDMINSSNHITEHFSAQVYKFLGICYGAAARTSGSDSERDIFQKEALNSLNHAVLKGNRDSDIIYRLLVENAVQRNLDSAFENALVYSGTEGSGKGWKLLSLILSAQQRLKDAKAVVDFGLDEAGRVDQLEFLRIKALLEVAEEEPKQAIKTYRVLLALVQAQKDAQAKSSDSNQLLNKSEVEAEKNLETMAWQDLAMIYSKLESWHDAEICLNKANSINPCSPSYWHTAGLVLEAQSLDQEALVSYSIALSLDPDHALSMISTAEVLMKLGSQSVPTARSFLMNAVRLEPTNHRAWWNLGLLCKMEGSPRQAADFFQAAYELKSTAPVQSFS